MYTDDTHNAQPSEVHAVMRIKAQIPLGTSRHVSTRHVRRVEHTNPIIRSCQMT